MSTGNARGIAGFAGRGAAARETARGSVRAIYEASALIDIDANSPAVVRHKNAALKGVAAVAHP
jgi:hypothetical protein